MNHLENMVDVKRSTLAKLIAALTSIALVLTMCNVSLFASYAWAADEEPAVEETQVEPTDEQPAFEEETPVVVDTDVEDEEEPEAEDAEEDPDVEDETPVVETESGASVLMAAEEVVMSEALTMTPMSVSANARGGLATFASESHTIKCGETITLTCNGRHPEVFTSSIWNSSDETIVTVINREIQYDPAEVRRIAKATIKGVGEGTVIVSHARQGDISHDDYHEATYEITVTHNWDDGVVTTESTCSAEGTKTFTCTGCGATKTESIAKKPHAVITDHAVAPTCTEKGLTEGSHCATCNEVIVAQEEIPALTHDWDEGVVTTEPTCTDEGIKTFTCQREGCNATMTEAVAILGHDMVGVAAIAPSCTKAGVEAGSHCSRCDYSEGFGVIPALGHDWTEWHVTQAPTCTEKGKEQMECRTCGGAQRRDIEPLGHTEEIIPGKAATCYYSGLTDGKKCSVCGEILVAQEEIPQFKHTWGEWVVTKAPTCTEPGKETKSCSTCPIVQGRDIPALGHTIVVDEAVAPTCTTDGMTEGSHCATCGEILVAQETIPATGHNTDGVVEHKDATCTEAGVVGGTYCTACDEGREAAEAVIEAKGHSIVTDEAVAPTCTETGLTEGSHCDTCGTVLVAQEIVDATGHDYVATVITEATCEADGVRAFTCTHDATHTYTEAIPATGHAYGEWTVVTPATIDGEGLEQRVCANDANHVEERAIAALPATTITWYDEDGTTELASMRYIQGTVEPSFAGEVPTKAEDADNTYAFSGWENVTRTDDTIAYRATYTATAKPVNPAPVDPTPVDPNPVDPTPVDPTPTPVDPTPTPDDPTPVDPTPGPVPGDEGTGTGAGTVTAPAGEAIADDATPLAAAPETAAPAAAAAPVATAAETIADDGNPLAAFPEGETIDDEGNPLASFELTPQCWVHWLMLIGIVITLFYGIGVVVNRRKDIQTVDEFEAEVMGKRPVRRSTAHRSQEA